MSPAEFAYLRDFLRTRSGLDLPADKFYLAQCRLAPLARQAGFSDLSQLVAALAAGDAALGSRVVEAMTTNESSFFRDKIPFDNFREIMVPHLLKARAARRRIRIWSAAAASGQEPYSLAMAVREDQRLAGWSADILASDLSGSVAARGRAGRYTQFEVQRGLPIGLLLKYFSQDGDVWEIDESIRRMVRWQTLNLLDCLEGIGRFDVVFCRNVLIYFDRKTKADVLSRLVDVLEPDGFLVLGAAETVVGLSDRFDPHPESMGLYRRVPAGQLPRAYLQVARTA